MRKLANFDDERVARTFADVLTGHGIDNDLREEGDGGGTLWVLEEDSLDEARELFQRFIEDPAAPEFQQAVRRARVHGEARAREAQQARHRAIEARKSFDRQGQRGTVTTGLILVSLMTTLVTELDHDSGLRALFSIADLQFDTTHVSWKRHFTDVRAGEVWRLITPIFLHGSFFHLLFNMWWLMDLGNPLEQRIGSPRLFALVLLAAALSNAAQFHFGDSPLFGGMSGVVYALFGYLWIRGDHDPRLGFALRRQLVGFFLIWWALGVSGVIGALMGPVANYCHTGGLLVGMAWGHLDSRLGRRRA